MRQPPITPDYVGPLPNGRYPDVIQSTLYYMYTAVRGRYTTHLSGKSCL
jgi:hypothetical protein